RRRPPGGLGGGARRGTAPRRPHRLRQRLPLDRDGADRQGQRRVPPRRGSASRLTPPMLAPIPEILEDLRNGRCIILVDDEGPENEGDLVCAAEKVTPEIINFMTRHTPGYLCVALTASDCDRLELHPQAVANTAVRGTAMTVSVDGHPRHGVGTGIAASDRARTARLLAEPMSRPD